MYRTLLIGILLIIGVNVAAYLSKLYSPNRDDERLKEVEQLFRAIPIYPGSEEVTTSSSSKDRIARLGKVYKTNASYDELKGFYTDSLTRLGWQPERERQIKDWWSDLGGRELRFRDGEYYISIEYAGEKANYGWNYGISVGWHAG
jgi:hypothetical protein